jgi:hypothetical protein
MHLRKSIVSILLMLPMVLLSGCGETAPSSLPASTLEASTACIDCHTFHSPGSGALIAEEWKSSRHNTEISGKQVPGFGAGCRDCHEPIAGHGDKKVCGAQCHGGGPVIPIDQQVVMNPDQQQKCNKCHGLNFPDDPMLKFSPQHFGNLTASTNNTSYRASYVSSQYVGNCRKCHNPHALIARDAAGKSIHAQWAESGKGNPRSGPFSRFEFKTRGTDQPVATSFENYCVRCHTTTGYINYVTSGFNDQHAWGAATDKTKQMIACNACHDDGNGRAYGFRVRKVPPVRVYYNISSTTRKPLSTRLRLNNTPRFYPDAAASNVCVPCHAGRGIGQLIKDAMTATDPVKGTTVSFRDLSRISAHDFAGAATLFRKDGYEYEGRDYDSSASGFQHDRVGMNGFNGTGTSGPCITCHLKSAESHSFLAVRFDETTHAITGILSRTCARCHNGTNPLAPVWTVDSLQAKKSGFRAALAMLSRLLDSKSPSVASITTNWFAPYSTTSQGSSKQQHGANTMGAFFNFDTLKNDWGAYAHNDLYAKRLIFDSIDWIFDGKPDLTTDSGARVETAINSVTLPTKSNLTIFDPVLGNLPLAANNAELSALKAAAITWLLGGPGGKRP